MLPGNGESGSTETLRFLEKKASAGIWSVDFATRKMSWSAGMYELLGLDPNTVAPSYAAFVELLHPDDRRRV
jgi:hypothetical protein